MIEGQDSKTGQFQKGNTLGKGRKQGSRNKITERMLQRFAERNEDGISVEEILFDIAQNKMESSDMRLKAASKLADLVFPKAQSVELKVEKAEDLSMSEMDERIKQLMGHLGNDLGNEQEESQEESQDEIED